MTRYRAYFFDRLDHARHAVDILCRDDQDAIARLTALADEHPALELWDGGRMVHRLDRLAAA